MPIRKPSFAIALGLITVLAVVNVHKAYGSDVEIIEIEKETIVFLTGSTCNERDWLQSRLPDYHVYCTNEPNVAWARMHFSGFEPWFYVIYVQEQYYDLTDSYSVAGITFNGSESGYAVAIGADFVIQHEREHLVCKCYKTADGHHG